MKQMRGGGKQMKIHLEQEKKQIERYKRFREAIIAPLVGDIYICTRNGSEL